ncbi:MAG: ABC transporter ATP-binding protein [Planctomycetaceae bacterium]
MSQSQHKYSTAELYGRLLGQARPYWVHLLGIGLLSLSSIPLALMMPLPLKIAVDNVIGSAPLPRPLTALVPVSIAASQAGVLLLAVTLVVLIALASQLQGMASAMLSIYTSQKLTLSFRERLFPHVQRLSPAFHDARGTSDSIYRILYDTAAVPAIVIDGVVPFATAGLTLVAMLLVTAQLNWRLALVALIVFPLLLLIAWPFSRRLRRQWEQGTQLASSIQTVLQEVLGAVRVVVAFGKEDSEKRRLMDLARQGMRTHLRIGLTKCVLDLLVGLMAASGVACVLLVGVRQVQSGAMTLGEFLVVMAYLTQLYGPMHTIIGKLGDIQASVVSVERALDLLDEVPDVVERPGAKSIGRASGKITFEEVGFGYDRKHPVLQEISFSILPGTRLGIVGATGAGKTTLVNLLTRFYDPTSGCVLLDDIDLRDYKLASLRNQFAMVLQDPVLFSCSIAENIAYGRTDATEDEIVEAAISAGADQFIERLPDRYHTTVGERGMRLSGGERQRISLARAFLKDAPILILDEPTSSVDVRTERDILSAMQRLMEGRTSLLIAHRPSTLQHCDKLLVIHEGRLQQIAQPASAEALQALMLGSP